MTSWTCAAKGAEIRHPYFIRPVVSEVIRGDRFEEVAVQVEKEQVKVLRDARDATGCVDLQD